MRKLLTCVLLGTLGIAPAQKGTIAVNRPGGIPRPPDECLIPVNNRLLDVIYALTDADSQNNEVKYENDNHLTQDQIYIRRWSVITETIKNLRAHKEGSQ